MIDKGKLKIEGFIDAKAKAIKEIMGYSVYTLEEVIEHREKAILLITAPTYHWEIEKYINRKASNFVTFFVDFTALRFENISGEHRKQYYTQNKERLLNIYNNLYDERSKDVLNHVLCGAVSSGPEWYENISGERVGESQYFLDFIQEVLTEREVFVDVGAYSGDSIEEFIEVVDGKYEAIYAFEPDDTARKQIKEEITKDKRIHIIDKGVGNIEKRLCFVTLEGGGSRCVDTAFDSQMIEIVKLDNLNIERVTFLKTDVEGMDLEVLQGAVELIKKNRPIMAVSVYHKMGHIIEIPEFILNLDLNYKLYLRHYRTYGCADTVLFAIPCNAE